MKKSPAREPWSTPRSRGGARFDQTGPRSTPATRGGDFFKNRGRNFHLSGREIKKGGLRPRIEPRAAPRVEPRAAPRIEPRAAPGSNRPARTARRAAGSNRVPRSCGCPGVRIERAGAARREPRSNHAPRIDPRAADRPPRRGKGEGARYKTPSYQGFTWASGTP